MYMPMRLSTIIMYFIKQKLYETNMIMSQVDEFDYVPICYDIHSGGYLL